MLKTRKAEVCQPLDRMLLFVKSEQGMWECYANVAICPNGPTNDLRVRSIAVEWEPTESKGEVSEDFPTDAEAQAPNPEGSSNDPA
jgi:hypothetical protein